MADFEIDLSGLEELKDDLQKAVKAYPDKAQETLEVLGKQFKKDTIKETYKAVNKKSGNLVKGYKVEKVHGYGMGMEVDFYAKAPHFHLIENGHEIILPKTRKGKSRKNGGKNKGFVPGRLIVKKVRGDYKEIVPEKMKKMVDEILEECNL
ncbi:HK97 gp10 family phage protein [Velocimicrobium porci]|uniref:HK97 gp10 family phage protein n=1 Tax=Velocimicrobium porci TaxID=2606634 RepID=A0A6L5XY39_9FIRM|nr:HK97 gp10 family phage protein [Velocimicrobium porci]MSS63178.1 HK97 gp10 family phage protein [Velocimicrobium porci]